MTTTNSLAVLTMLQEGRFGEIRDLFAPALRPLVAGALATVVPSRWYENQPMTILESYALEVPAVVTAMGGMPELVEAGTDGLVVPHDDPAALAAALAELADDPHLAMTMGAKGRARLAAEFAPDLHLQRLERVYVA